MKKKKVSVDEVILKLKENYPDAHCALHFTNPFQLLLATILSAQCTDERVNKVTPNLFKRYPTPKHLAKARLEDVEEIIRSTNFYKNKAKNLIKCAETLVSEHQGEVPAKMESLIGLAGVGRKTANVVLGNAFHITSGIVVDTHVGRLANRLGWTRQQTPEKIEKELLPKVNESDWIIISHLLISHGRAICKARSPSCDKCFLVELCPKVLNNKRT
jgi:endonuclease-3